MGNNITLSVIIPVYNAGKNLEKNIRSVQDQTKTDLEIILVDDGSTDGSGVLCDKIAESDARIVVIHKKNGGAGSARNEGLRAAHGKYVSFMDADDFIESTMFYVMYELCVQNDLDIIRCNTVIHENNRQKVCWVPMDFCRKVLDREIIRKKIIPTMIAPENEAKYKERLLKGCVCCLFRKSLIDENAIAFSNLKSGEDAMFTMTAMWKSEKIMLLSETFYHYVKQNSGSLSISLDRLQDYRARKRTKDMILSIVNDEKVLPIFLKRLEQSARRYAYFDIRIATVYNPEQKAKEKIKLIKKIVNDPETVEAFSKPYQGKLPFKMAFLYYLIKHKFSRLLYFFVSVKGKS